MANSGDGSGSTRGRTGMVIDAVSGVIVDAKGVVTPLPKAAAKELRKLEKGLAAARKTESKRLRQVAAAHGPEAGAEIAKRRKQAEEAASEVASLASRIAGVATSAAGSAASTVGDAIGGAAKGVIAAAGQAAAAVTPGRTGPAPKRPTSTPVIDAPTTAPSPKSATEASGPRS